MMEEYKSYLRADYKRELYEALVKSYNTDKDLFDTYGEVFMLKRSRDDKDKDQDPFAGLDRGTKRRKSSKDAESSRDPKSKESNHTVGDSEVQQNQEFDTGNNDEQPDDEVASKVDWFRKPERPPTPDPDWNKRQHVDFRPPQTWISNISRIENPPTSFNELMDTPIDFFAFVINRLNITNLTQELLVGPAFNLLKGTCKSCTELEYHFEECFKATTERIDWNNPEGKQYPLPLIEAQGRQVVPADYFFNNDLEYLKGGSASRKYTTSTTKTKAAKYDNIEGIEDMVPMLWSRVKCKHDVFSRKRIIAVTYVKVMKWYGYGYLEEIIVRREDLTQKLSNLEQDVIFNLNVALGMFTRRIVILKRVEDLQLGVESYQKKLNITKPKTFRSDISKLTSYTTYKNPQGIIYHDKFKRNRLMRSDVLYKFCDGTLTSFRRVLHDIANNLRMDYLPKRRWSNLDIKRSRIMIKAIDQQLFERRLMRNLKKFAGGREYGNDFRLLEWTI
ncbi:hypothetical protein Tco_0901543 [Tanacetum coccineum]